MQPVADPGKFGKTEKLGIQDPPVVTQTLPKILAQIFNLFKKALLS